MSKPEMPEFDPATFSGRVRLFPLPNLVLFPHILQPLHIFESRYRAMFEEAIEDDGLIATAHLLPGWERDYEGRPPLYPRACLGRIATYSQLAGGSYNLLLQGLRRIELVREIDNGKTFREAEVELLEDYYPPETATVRPARQEKLLKLFERIMKITPVVHEQLEELLSTDTPLGMLADIVGYTIDWELAFKDKLLAEVNVDRRVEMILKRLARPVGHAVEAQGDPVKFPPEFSIN